MSTDTLNDTDFQVLLRMIDESIADLGTSGLVDGRNARDKLLDVRGFVMKMQESCMPQEVI